MVTGRTFVTRVAKKCTTVVVFSEERGRRAQPGGRLYGKAVAALSALPIVNTASFILRAAADSRLFEGLKKFRYLHPTASPLPCP